MIMTQEEKAKRYDDVIRKAKITLDCCTSDSTITEHVVYDIFPELKENEDERIKNCIGMCLTDVSEQRFKDYNTNLRDCLAWLEKKGKQKLSAKEDEVRRVSTIQILEYARSLPDYNQFGKDDIDKNIAWIEKQDETNIQNNNSLKIESDKFYFCIKDYFAGGCCRSKKGDVVLAKNGMNMMGLSPKEASEYFMPINPFNEYVVAWFEKQRQCEHKKFMDQIQIGDKVTRNEDGVLVNISQLKRIAKPINKPQGKTAIEAINEEKTDNSNKFTPKFKVGDWITDGYFNCNIIHVLDDRYIVDTKYNKVSSILFEDVPSRWWLWTIEDVKDGDILISDGNPFIFKDFSDSRHPGCPVAYGGIDCTNNFIIPCSKNYWWTSSPIRPATKEQHDFLFQKMNESGYEWDGYNKELIKLHNV